MPDKTIVIRIDVSGEAFEADDVGSEVGGVLGKLGLACSMAADTIEDVARMIPRDSHGNPCGHITAEDG